MNKENAPTIEINTEIMVEINNLCHFNEPRKVADLIKYMIPQWYKDGKADKCIYLRHIYLRHSPNPYSSVIYEGLPSHILLFCWKEKEGVLHSKDVLHSKCYVSVAENPEFRKAFHLDFSGMDDQDCDPDELGWYYFMGKTNNLEHIVNYSGSEYIPVFQLIGNSITCCRPPVIRHKYQLETLKSPCNDYELKQKYYDLLHTGNWNAKHAIERGGFNLNG